MTTCLSLFLIATIIATTTIITATTASTKKLYKTKSRAGSIVATAAAGTIALAFIQGWGLLTGTLFRNGAVSHSGRGCKFTQIGHASIARGTGR